VTFINHILKGGLLKVTYRFSNTLFLLLFLSAAWIQAEETEQNDLKYKPYILAKFAEADVKANLQKEGFEVVGEYTPYQGAKVIVVTNETLKTIAAQSNNGGFGAVMRVAITDGVVSYTNPPYWANAYRMTTELTEVATALTKALGKQEAFGSQEGMTKNELREYYYAPFMPYFDQPVELGSYSSHQQCVKTVEAGLKSKRGRKGQTQFVYRVDIPKAKGELESEKQTVFGMGILGESEGADNSVMTTLNPYTGKPEHTAYMPYEILCADKKALMLHSKFRIAVSFPELKMWPFMMIRGAPRSIKKAAKAAARLIKNR
jgi:3-methyladenine DNA glycosylase Tag